MDLETILASYHETEQIGLFFMMCFSIWNNCIW